MAIYGGFPVKLKTIVGKPIHFDPEDTVEEIAEKVRRFQWFLSSISLINSKTDCQRTGKDHSNKSNYSRLNT